MTSSSFCFWLRYYYYEPCKYESFSQKSRLNLSLSSKNTSLLANASNVAQYRHRSITKARIRVLITTKSSGGQSRPDHILHPLNPKMSVAPMLSMSTNNTSSTSLTRHLDNPVPPPCLGLDPVLATSFGLDHRPAPPISFGLDIPVPPTSYGLDSSIPQPILDLDISIDFDDDTAVSTPRSDTPQPCSDDGKNKNKAVVILGPPAAGTIAQRRALTRAIRSFAQRQLRTQFSTTSLSHRLEQQRESSRTRQRSPSRSRDLQLQRSHEVGAIAMRRCQNRVLRSQRRASSRLGYGQSLAPPGQTTGGGVNGQRVLVKKASKIGSEMMFFGEFKANPGKQWFNGCVVS